MALLGRRGGTAVTASAVPPSSTRVRPLHKGNVVVDWLTTTDHKKIGYLYLIASMMFFMVGGVMALVIRAQLAAPGHQIITPVAYNQLFTMHGSIMLLLFAMPFFTGVANVMIPVQIGAPDVAFPRLNMLAFWLTMFGGLIVALGLLMPQGPADFGWFAYQPLAAKTFAPSLGDSLWFVGVFVMGFGTILSAVNFITTIICLRAPGMTMFRLSVFTWNTLVTSILVLLAFPVLAAAVSGVIMDREWGAHLYDAPNGGALMWQHLFWFWGHPEVYIIALPFFGMVSEIVPVFSRKPIFGYKTLVYATISIAALSVSVWAHHMYVTGGVLLPFFSVMTMMIAVPTGVKIFNWVGTMWRGSITFESPMLFAVGFLVVFTFGGLTGVILASPPLDFHVSDSYFVVAHFHYVLIGAVVFGGFAALYYWWPKWTGKMLNEKLAVWHFWLLFLGFNATFLIQHWLGVIGMPRRYFSYSASDGFTWMNELSTIGAIVQGISMIPFLLNVFITWRNGARVTANDPWGFGRSLEWATGTPLPRHNFVAIPRIRSESPAFDLNHPEAAAVPALPTPRRAAVASEAGV
ncbi:cytochrome c oxidase subunit I [Gryllotalpicola reticulitermitis]|uniref:Cytochrome c oxidase subunit 1 n=1 Tax=Gryllotalpicola reticulitermitis TaxID=1184153 RepID=A0ABV8Q4D0_9MICO